MQNQPIHYRWSSTPSLDSDDDLSSEDDDKGDCQRNFRAPEVRLPSPTNTALFDPATEIVAVSTRRFYRSTTFLDVYKISTLIAEQHDGSVLHLHEFSRTDFKQWLPLDERISYPSVDEQSWSSDVDRSWLSDEELGPSVVERRASDEKSILPSDDEEGWQFYDDRLRQEKIVPSNDEEMWEFYDEQLWASVAAADDEKIQSIEVKIQRSVDVRNIQPLPDEEKISELVEDLSSRDVENVDIVVPAELVEAMAEPALIKRRSFLSSIGRRIMNAGRKMFCCGVKSKRAAKH